MTKNEKFKMILASIYLNFEKEKFTEAMEKLNKAGRFLIQEYNKKK